MDHHGFLWKPPLQWGWDVCSIQLFMVIPWKSLEDSFVRIAKPLSHARPMPMLPRFSSFTFWRQNLCVDGKWAQKPRLQWNNLPSQLPAQGWKVPLQDARPSAKASYDSINSIDCTKDLAFFVQRKQTKTVSDGHLKQSASIRNDQKICSVRSKIQPRCRWGKSCSCQVLVWSHKSKYEYILALWALRAAQWCTWRFPASPVHHVESAW